MVNRTHSLKELKTAVTRLASRGGKVIDQRTAIGKSLMCWRGEIERDLGGSEQLSGQEHTVLDIAMRTKLLLDSTDAWLIRQPGLIDKRKKQLWPIVAQRAALADSLVRYLTTLGLGRKAKQVQSLSDYLQAVEAEKTTDPEAEKASEPNST